MMKDSTKTKKELIEELSILRARLYEEEDSINDIVECNKTVDALRESEEKYSSLFKKMLNGFAYHKIVVDKKNRPVDYIFLEVNDAFENLTGLKREDIIGKRVKEVIPDIEKSEFDWIGEYGKIALEGGELRFEQYFEPLDKWYSIIGYSNKKDYFAAVFEEITARKHAEELIKKSLTEKEVLLKEVHHRVKNNLQVVNSMLNLQSNYIDDKKMKGIFMESQDRIRSMALVHEQLYQSKDLSSINVAYYLKSLKKNLFNTYKFATSLVQCNADIEEIKLNIDTAIPLGIIMNELCTNALKHAFQEGTRGELKVEFKHVGSDNCLLLVSDNGVGLPKDLDITNTESMGFLLIKSMIEQLNGSLQIEQGQGTTFKITFPM
jgi:PAS domain S-box-containing protein